MRADMLWFFACASALGACGGAEDAATTVLGGGRDGGADAGAIVPDGAAPSTPVAPIVPSNPGADGNTCLVQPVDVKGEPPDMLIVLDASLSMAATRWGPSVEAVKKVTAQYENSVDFGLAVFPPGGLPSCGAPNLDVAPGPHNAQAIVGALPIAPAGFTPTGAALTAALGFLGPRAVAGPDVKASKPAYVLLFTDGQPDCPGPDAVASAQALHDAGIPVFVIGYGIDVLGDAMMNQIAQAGGTDHYYKVEDSAGGAGLDAALAAITKDVVRCDFDLNTTSDPDAKYIYVTIDGNEIPLSADGWSVTGRHITLNGQACSSLKDGAIHAVNAEIRCEPLR